MDNNFKIDLPKIVTRNPVLDQINQERRERMDVLNGIGKEVAERRNKEMEIQEMMLQSLKGIQENTAHLAEIMFLIREGNVARDEIYNLLVELLKIMIANSTEEAEGIFNSVLEKAVKYNAGYELITMLSTHGKLLIDVLKKTLENNPPL